MDYLKLLCSYPVLRRVIRDASERTGPWRRFFFCGPLANFVYKVKQDSKAEFEQCLDVEGVFVERLRSGDLKIYSHEVVHYLYLDNPGRVCVSLAFVTWLLDLWDLENQFSPDFALDSLCVPLWKLIKAEVLRRDLQGASQVFQEEIIREGLLDPSGTLVPQTPQREDTEEGDLHLAEPAVVQETSSEGEQEDLEMPPLEESENEEEVGSEESLGEEEMEEVETEQDDDLEIVFASDNDVMSPTPDLLRRDVASGLSSSSEEDLFSPLSGIAPLASSDSSCSDTEGEEQVVPPSGEPTNRVSVIVRAPARGTEGGRIQRM